MIISERKLRFLIKQQLLSENGLTIGNVIGDFINDMQDSNSDDAIKIAVKKNGIIIQTILALLDISSLDIFNDFYKRNFSEAMKNDNFLKSQNFKKKEDVKNIKKSLNDFIKDIKQVYNLSDFLNSPKAKATKFKEAFVKFKNSLNNYIPKWAPLQFLFYNINNKEFLGTLSIFIKENENKFQEVVKNFWILTEDGEKEISEKVIEYIKNQATFTERQINEILADTLDQAKDFSSEEDGNILAGVMDSAYNFLFQGSEFNMAGYGGISQKITGGLKDINKQFGLGDKIENILTSSWEELQKNDGEGLKALMAPDTPLGKFIEGVLNQQTSKMSSKEFGEAIEQILSIKEPLKSGMPDKNNPNVSRSGQKVYKSFEFKK